MHFEKVLLLLILFIMTVDVVWLMMDKHVTEFLFLMLIILLIIVINLVIQTRPKIYRFFNVVNQEKSFNLDRILYLCIRLRDNIPLILQRLMVYLPGELRFCEDCIHRIIVNGLQNNEIWCKRHGHRLRNGSEANQCILSGDFIETAVSKENRKDLHVMDSDNILLL